MKWTTAIFVALALSFWFGRATAPVRESELASVASFQRSLEDKNWLTRSHRFSSFLVGLNPENLPDALEAFEPHLPWLNTDEYRLFMLAWARFDPSGAFDQARSWPPEIQRKAGAAAMYAWGFYSPLEAVRELNTVEDADLKAFWGGRLFAGWVHGEYRDSVNTYVAAFPEGPTRRQHLETLAWEIAKEGPEAVMRWAENVPEDPAHFKVASFLKAASILAGIDAPLAARWLESHLDRDYADNALLAVASLWALRDAPAAMGWLTGLPAGKQRTVAVKTGFGVWFNHAPKDAQRWLRSASPARAVNPAVRFMVEETRDENPRFAQEWEARLVGTP
jgi:hypothetical protein